VSTLELANVAATLMSGGKWCPPSPLREVLDRSGKPVQLKDVPCEQVITEPLANTLVAGMSKDSEIGTAAAPAREVEWTRPMLAKTGTTEDYKSAAFMGATPDLAGAVQTFNDGPTPRGICVDGKPRLCAEGTIYGGTVPARTWFDTMKRAHADLPVKPLPPTDERYVKGDSGIRIPDVANENVDAATRILEKAGYKVSTQDRDSAQARGTVIGQTPNGSALRGTTVTLLVSNGHMPPPQPTPLPGTPGPTGPPEPSGAPTPARPGPPTSGPVQEPPTTTTPPVPGNG
jgi:membrane peptidoglycan carboxypeptidase